MLYISGMLEYLLSYVLHFFKMWVTKQSKEKKVYSQYLRLFRWQPRNSGDHFKTIILDNPSRCPTFPYTENGQHDSTMGLLEITLIAALFSMVWTDTSSGIPRSTIDSMTKDQLGKLQFAI